MGRRRGSPGARRDLLVSRGLRGSGPALGAWLSPRPDWMSPGHRGICGPSSRMTSCFLLKFPDCVFSLERALCLGLRGQHVPCHRPQDRHHARGFRQAGPGAPGALAGESRVRAASGPGPPGAHLTGSATLLWGPDHRPSEGGGHARGGRASPAGYVGSTEEAIGPSRAGRVGGHGARKPRWCLVVLVCVPLMTSDASPRELTCRLSILTGEMSLRPFSQHAFYFCLWPHCAG